MTKRGRRIAHVHEQVREVAVGMAHEVYAELMRRNDWYDLWKKSNREGLSPKRLEEIWVNRHWGKFITSARATMAGMLAGPYDEGLKEKIMDALLLDNTLVRGRKTPQFQMN